MRGNRGWPGKKVRRGSGHEPAPLGSELVPRHPVLGACLLPSSPGTSWSPLLSHSETHNSASYRMLSAQSEYKTLSILPGREKCLINRRVIRVSLSPTGICMTTPNIHSALSVSIAGPRPEREPQIRCHLKGVRASTGGRMRSEREY